MKWFELVGTILPIRDVKHICLATNDNALLLLQFGDDGSPCQYIAAHEPYWFNGVLCWQNGDYFPFFQYATTADALLEATTALQG